MLEKSEVRFWHTICDCQLAHSSSQFRFLLACFVLRATSELVEFCGHCMLCYAMRRPLTHAPQNCILARQPIGLGNLNLPFLIHVTPLHTAHLHFQNGMGKFFAWTVEVHLLSPYLWGPRCNLTVKDQSAPLPKLSSLRFCCNR